jgi:hypothetical protein
VDSVQHVKRSLQQRVCSGFSPDSLFITGSEAMVGTRNTNISLTKIGKKRGKEIKKYIFV